MALGDVLGGVRNAYHGLSEREQRLVAMLGVVLAVLGVALPLFLLTRAISELEDETIDYANVLRDVDRARESIAERRAVLEASERRYRTSAPPLRTFLTREAERQTVTVERVDDQPEKTTGGFKRRHVRAEMRAVGLRPSVQLLAAIENSEYPIAIERIDMSRYGSAEQYNLKIGVVAFDREAPTKQAGAAESSQGKAPRRSENGPPEPPR